LIIIGVFSWLDYRNEECDIADEMIGPGYRKRPNPRNFFRWYETYVVAFILCSITIMWTLCAIFLLPAMK
jgi:hypothetical protein